MAFSPLRQLTPHRQTLFLIVFVGFAVRVVGLAHGLPHIYHPDEHNLSFRALDAMGHGGNPGWFEYPTLTLYCLSLVYSIMFLVGKVFGQFQSGLYVAFVANPAPFHMVGRLMVVAFGTLSIVVAYTAAKRMSGVRCGLIAAFFVSICFLLVQQSHFLTVDIPTSFWVLLWACVVLGGITDFKSLSRVAILAGMATGSKYNCGLLMIPLYIYAARRYKDVKMSKAGAMACVLGFFLLGFLVSTPYAIFDFATFKSDLAYQAYTSRGGSLYGAAPFGLLRYLMHSLPIGLGFPLLIVSIMGTYRAVRRGSDSMRIVAAGGLLMLLFLAPWPRAWARWLVPIVPLMLLFAAWEVEYWIQKLKLTAKQTAVFAVMVPILIAVPCIPRIIALDLQLPRTDTRSVAYEWIEENIPQGVPLYRTEFGPQFAMRMGSLVLTENSLIADRTSFDKGVPFAPPRLQWNNLPLDCVVILNSFYLDPVPAEGKRLDYAGNWIEAVQKGLSENGFRVLFMATPYADFETDDAPSRWTCEESIYAPFGYDPGRCQPGPVVIVAQTTEKSARKGALELREDRHER
jgi:Dolichyl-phosphate-mannose-protein mannosyltransferase